jgi:hypothetical protein
MLRAGESGDRITAGSSLGSSQPTSTGGSFPEGKAVRGVNLATYFHLTSKLRTSGGIPILPSHAFIACTRTTLLSLKNTIQLFCRDNKVTIMGHPLNLTKL